MSIRPALVLCTVLLLGACGRTDRPSIVLTPNSLFNIDSVRAAMASGSSDGKNWERKINQATALMKAKHQYAEAADSLRNILFVAPSPRGYYEYGSALLLNKQFPEAVKALRIAEQLQYQPLPNVMYRLAVAYANCKNADSLPLPNESKTIDEAVTYYMQRAIQMGLANPERFLKDSAMMAYISGNHYQFLEAYNDAMTGRKDPMGSPFKDFLAGFSTLSLPASLDTGWLLSRKLSDNDFIAMFFEPFVSEMRGAKFAREDFSEYFYIAKVKETPNYVAVIYAVADAWDAESEESEDGSSSDSDSTAGKESKFMYGSSLDTLSSVYYFLTTYTPDGKLIDKISIAGQKSLDMPLRVAKLSVDLNLEITDLDLIRADDPSSADRGYKNNPVVGVRANASEHYHINAQGKLEKGIGAALSMR